VEYFKVYFPFEVSSFINLIYYVYSCSIICESTLFTCIYIYDLRHGLTKVVIKLLLQLHSYFYYVVLSNLIFTKEEQGKNSRSPRPIKIE